MTLHGVMQRKKISLEYPACFTATRFDSAVRNAVEIHNYLLHNAVKRFDAVLKHDTSPAGSFNSALLNAAWLPTAIYKRDMSAVL